MSMRLHSQWIAPSASMIRATGGGAANQAILQILADVFNADVVRIAPPNAASLGAALRAFHADRLSAGTPLPWPEVVAGFTDPIAGETARPRPDAVARYTPLLTQFESLIRNQW